VNIVYVLLGISPESDLQRLDVEFILHIEPLKMDLTEGFETSAKHNLTPGKYPKEHIQDSEHGVNLKLRNCEYLKF
jgi:hypothetical protein